MFPAEASAPARAGGENVFTQGWVGVGAGGRCQDTCVTGKEGPTEARVYIFDLVCVCVCVFVGALGGIRQYRRKHEGNPLSLLSQTNKKKSVPPKTMDPKPTSLWMLCSDPELIICYLVNQ